MEEKDLKSVGIPDPQDAPLAARQHGSSAEAIVEYLFADWPALDSSIEAGGALSDEEERAIAKIVDSFLKAQYEETSVEAERCMNSRHPEISHFALLAHAFANVALNKIEVARKDLRALQAKEQNPENQHNAALNDIYRFVLSAFFHLGDKTTSVPMELFSHCSEGARLFMLYAQSYALYLQQEYGQALGVAEAALVMAADRHLILRIYLNLVASMAAINLSRFELSDRFFLKALELAKPDGYIQPFIGHHGPLQGLVEKHIREHEPELYLFIAEKVTRFRRGWTEIHNPLSYGKVTNLLTPYEFSLAMMAAKGKTNQEIADNLNISINTVKAYLSMIFQKIGITKRSELAEYLNK
ncbi:MAG: LuxR C-terminal-related transcriptional regulator [Bacillota bacterium]|nr:LuxR C-terminal-related transcriptional regulator [Bacillota bacterium]